MCKFEYSRKLSEDMMKIIIKLISKNICMKQTFGSVAYSLFMLGLSVLHNKNILL